MRSLVIALCALLLAAGASAQKPVDRTIWVAPGGFVRIYNMAGSVRVYGWDKDSLQIQGTVQEPPAGEFVVSPGKQGAKVSVWGPTEIGVKPTDLTIRVPRRSQLWIKTQSATISVQDFEGGLDLVSVTGAITVNGRPSELYAESMGGDLKLAVTTRSARAKTGTGTITLNGVVDDATLTTVSGALSVFNSRIMQGHFESVEGAIRYTGLFNTPSSLEFINHSGDVELNVPVNANVNVSIDLFSGSFKDEYGVKAKQMAGKLKARLFSFQIGEDLGADVAVKSFKGTVIVRKAPALKTVQ
jgi:DUF4097 and DUF4098 domain-containing protein YvlB